MAVLKGCFEPILDLFHLNPEKVNIYTILEFFWYFVKVYIYYDMVIPSVKTVKTPTYSTPTFYIAI